MNKSISDGETGTLTPAYRSLLERIKEDLRRSGTREEKLKSTCHLLRGAIPYYHWVGFYLVPDPAKPELVLGPFAGTPTEHTRIAFGKGICGQAAQLKETFVVADVARETNYLACSPLVKSEIVVPILKDNRVIGELDIDSHRTAPFTKEDRAFLETLCQSLAELF